MEENSNLLNETTSSWIDDEGLYKRTEELQNLQTEKQIKVGCFGDKYILNDGCKQYFAKETDELLFYFDKYYYSHIALYSAFISCFSHTPYPITIITIDDKKYTLYRYDKKKEINNYTTNTKKPIIEQVLCKVPNVDIMDIALHKINKDKNITSMLSNRDIKNIVQICIHQIFFYMEDRKFENFLFCQNGIHYIDIDSPDFMFSQHTNNKYKKHIEKNIGCIFEILNDLDIVCKDNNKGDIVEQYIKLEINKIKDINFETFIERYIGRCVALDVDKETAFDYLNNKFLNNMKIYYTTLLNILDTIYTNDVEKQNNNFYKEIKKEASKVWNNFQNKINELKYMTNKELFLQKFDEIKETLKERRKQTDVKVHKKDEKCINIEPISIKKKDENDNETDEKSKQILINENKYNNNDISNKNVETSNCDTIINDSNVYYISEEKIDQNKMIISTDEDHTNVCCCGISLNDINPFRWFKQK